MNLVDALAHYFHIGETFAAAYVRYFQTAQGVVLRTVRDLESLSETQEMWFHYALSTNCRGADLIGVIEQFTPLNGKRYLDIGCGFGGCVVAGARRGASCIGIEVDEQRIAFAHANIADSGLSNNAHILRHDVLDPGIVPAMGRFDVITCNDVAEHVDSVAQLFENLGNLLAPGGIVCMEIPNKYSLEFVAHDGHFGLFGITLLERPEARQYHAQVYRHPYDVGDYLSLQEYLDLFRRFRMEPELMPSLYHPVHDVSALQARLVELARRRAAFSADTRITHEMRALMGPVYERYRLELALDLLGTYCEDMTVQTEVFCNKYLRNFWTFLARKR
ncbi:MAG TPA: methyltransferase domain-containing protein [Bryobacteraceae bacterium]|nr:methyltransferase domain-containing protein [Bryobacteraceae bacterium]